MFQGTLEHEEGAEGVLYADSEAGTATGPVATNVNDRVLEDYVLSPTAAAVVEPMTDRAAWETMHVLRLAYSTGKAPLIETALVTLEQLIARGFLVGEVTSLLLEGEGRSSEEGSMNSRGLSNYPEYLPVLAQALHLMCCCEDFAQDEEVEVCTSLTCKSFRCMSAGLA
jgi:hypothetical protein